MNDHECLSKDGIIDCICDPIDCDECYGDGSVSCWNCGGDGIESCGEDEETCDECAGSGLNTCDVCGGTGEEMRKAPESP